MARVKKPKDLSWLLDCIKAQVSKLEPGQMFMIPGGWTTPKKVLWCVVWCGVVWCGVVWCGVVWCGVVWCGVACERVYGEQINNNVGVNPFAQNHGLIYMVERQATSFTFFVCNTGEGVQYHPASTKDPPKMKFKTTVRFDNIPREKILDEALWYMLFKIQATKSDNHRLEILYEIVLP
jgi:hypothetical protein